MEPLLFVVDDDPFFCRIVSSILKKNNLNRISIFDSGEDCIKNITDETSVIFLDYDMSGMNGIEVLKFVRNTYPKITVIMVSAQDKMEVAISALKMGAYDYLIKDNQLLSKIENTLKELREMTILHEEF